MNRLPPASKFIGHILEVRGTQTNTTHTPREQLCNRCCSNKHTQHTHTLAEQGEVSWSVLQITMEHTMTEWHVQKTQTPKKQACASVSQGYHKVGTQSYTDVPICSACAAGMYWIEEQCVSCPEYSSTAAPGALSVAECACVAGYFMQEEKCKQCPADSFQSTLGGACTACPLNAISAPGSDSQTDCFCKACFSGADCA